MLPARQEPVLDSSKYTAADVCITDQKLWVCDICGAFLSVYDSDRRLADHFGGKLHLGYMQIRDKLAKLQEKRNKNRKLDQYDERRSKERSRYHERESSHDQDQADSCDPEGGIMIEGAEIVTGTMIENMVGIMIALGLMILEVPTGHVQGLRNVPGIMIVTDKHEDKSSIKTILNAMIGF
ncbi:hypothetical protein SLA2020_051670 [Shorea laevis]